MTGYQTFENLTVQLVGKEDTRKMMVENHYAKKWNTAFGVVNVGVYSGDGLLGAASCGHPMNPSSWGSITSLSPEHCLELNRLWIDDELGRNTETWLMARSWSI